MTWFAVHWCAAIFEVVVPLFYSCDTHGIVPESLLNLSNSFHLGIAKLLTKFVAIPLLKSFHHFAIIDNPTSVHNTYTIIDQLPATDAFYRREKFHACAWMSPTSTMMDTSRAWFVYVGKIKVRTFWTGHVQCPDHPTLNLVTTVPAMLFQHVVIPFILLLWWCKLSKWPHLSE